MNIYKYLLMYCFVGLMPAIPCGLFALYGKYTPVLVIVLLQVLTHYLFVLWMKKSGPELKVPVNDLLYWAIIVPLIAYSSNVGSDRTIAQSASMYVIFQVLLNGCTFWFFYISPWRQGKH